MDERRRSAFLSVPKRDRPLVAISRNTPRGGRTFGKGEDYSPYCMNLSRNSVRATFRNRVYSLLAASTLSPETIRGFLRRRVQAVLGWDGER